MSAKPDQPVKLYRHPVSGHSHRVALFMSLTGLPVELIDVDLKGGEHRTPSFRQKNPFGQIPVIEDGSVTVADSNAILVYLAIKYADASWLPRDAEGAARVQRYLSLAAGEIASGPMLARKINIFNLPLDLAKAQADARKLFSVLDEQLAGGGFLVGEQPTIADVACYSYIAHAPEGGISLDEYSHLRAWLKRIESLPGFIALQKMPVGLFVA